MRKPLPFSGKRFCAYFSLSLLPPSFSEASLPPGRAPGRSGDRSDYPEVRQISRFPAFRSPAVPRWRGPPPGTPYRWHCADGCSPDNRRRGRFPHPGYRFPRKAPVLPPPGAFLRLRYDRPGSPRCPDFCASTESTFHCSWNRSRYICIFPGYLRETLCIAVPCGCPGFPSRRHLPVHLFV